MARATGFEPATSTVTGWHSNQLSYAPAISCMKSNIHPGFGKSKLKLEKSTKKLFFVRKLASGTEWGSIRKEAGNLSVKMAERGCVSRDLPNFAQKTANSSFLPQMMYIMAHF